MSMNTRSSGSARVDDIQSHPKGEIRGQTKPVKITEDVRKFAAQQKSSEEKALQAVLEQNAREFTEAGGEIYSPSLKA